MDSTVPSAQRVKWYKQITVEPTMFLYMFAFMFTNVVEQAFFVRKACLINHKYPPEICDNIKDYENITKEVHITTSNFIQYDGIAGHVFPIILALFLGSWSDKRGRKLPLIIGLFGKLIYSTMIIVNESQPWPLEYVIFTATLPCALTGADIAIFASCFAYLTDVSSVENRIIRITILEACYLITMPTGIALGSYIFSNCLNKSYTWMFAINACLLVIAILYSLVALQWQTNPRQRPYSELTCCAFLPDFFDQQHVVDSIKVLTRKRRNNHRLFFILLLVSMGLYTFVRDEKTYMYLYTQFKFKWDNVKDYSHFKTFYSATYLIVMLISVPIMNKVLKWRDTVIILFGCTFYAIARLIYFFAEVPYVFYIGGLVCAFGPVAAPAIRSFISKMMPTHERGKAFALLSVCDNAVPFVSSVLYTQIYQATVDKMGGIFLLSFTCLIIAICLVSIVHFKLGNNTATASDEDNEITEQDSVERMIQEEKNQIERGTNS